MKRWLQVVSVVLGLAAAVARGQGTYEGIVNYSPSTVGSLPGTAGWTFSPDEGIMVTALGIFNYVITGQGPTIVGLWNSAGALLASNRVTTASSLENQTRYESISPVLLAAGQVYSIGAYSESGSLLLESFIPGSGGGAFVLGGQSVTLRGYGNFTGGFGFPAEEGGASGIILFGPNFKDQIVPEPSAVLLGCCGLCAVMVRRRRRN